MASGSRSSSPSPSRSDEEVREELLDPDFGEEDAHVEEETSVIAGGSREGWSPVVAVVLWRRMLGILGNVNKIKEPQIHAEVFECLTSVWNMLAKVTVTTRPNPIISVFRGTHHRQIPLSLFFKTSLRAKFLLW